MTRKGYRQSPEHIQNNIKARLQPEASKRISESLKRHYAEYPETSLKKSQSTKQFYLTHQVWNKGHHWPVDIRERIRQGCMNSEIGMGPKIRQGEIQALEIIKIIAMALVVRHIHIDVKSEIYCCTSRRRNKEN